MPRRWFFLWAGAAFACCLAPLPVAAQSPPGWQTDTSAPANTTVVPRSPAAPMPTGGAGIGQVSLTARLTDHSQDITQGLVWRVFRDKSGPDGKPAFVSMHREPSPTLRLEPGVYLVNVAVGRANLTRKITVTGEQVARERFVLNAGGLRVNAVLASGEATGETSVSFDLQSDELDQHGERTKVVTGAKPGVVLRVNAGIYSIVSRFGDANAVARADVSVEAGKLSEVTLIHAAARVSFKLVTRRGGDAIADTQWSVTTSQGETVKESAGALPTHFLAPGTYVVNARHAGRTFRGDFTVRSGDSAQVEVVMP
jgi:hypothetical protein